jgi:S-(hydroxymethyl)glutathione dehydrogenase/alcohol dehydrogenase
MLTQGAAAVVAGSAALLGTRAAQAASAAPGTAPPTAPSAAAGAAPTGIGVATPNMKKGVIFWGRSGEGVDPDAILAERQGPTRSTGMKFRAVVRHDTVLTTEQLTLLPLHPLQVLVRVQAVQTCYSATGLLITQLQQAYAVVGGHGGVGIVEEVGHLVKRVKVGDQVIMATTPQCGVCLYCQEGRADLCNTRLPAIPSATMSNGTPVYMTAPPAGPAGYSEVIVIDEDWVVPVFTKVSPAELSILSCVGGTGLGLAMCRFPVESGTDVAVLGLGPLGLSAVQGARIQGAKTIIGVDPIKYRRELALKLGATHVLDSNELRGNALLDRIRELTPDIVPVGRRYAGERTAGPKYVFEAAGGTRLPLPASVESPYDMTGVEVLQQAWRATRAAGYVRTTSIGHPAGSMVSFPATQWALGSNTHVPGNYAGVQALHDLPRFVRLVEQGLFDAKSLVGKIYRPDKMIEAMQVSADRSSITSVIEFT